MGRLKSKWETFWKYILSISLYYQYYQWLLELLMEYIEEIVGKSYFDVLTKESENLLVPSETLSDLSKTCWI